ncbi:hypothetical protein KP509_07G076200 [Ceratopteris richardii]|uniref:Uncharacterized protein n=1 Tax=Ceratopteris richardii TaxID=49495 RepID=A0A8T2UGG8_CERRI|nr:hypothetical protein KP509_07G076200 [Ceratopteris richardii]
MCLVFVCDEDREVLGAQQMPGACPVCGGVVTNLHVRSSWRFCFIPLCFRSYGDLACNRCGTRLKQI